MGIYFLTLAGGSSHPFPRQLRHRARFNFYKLPLLKEKAGTVFSIITQKLGILQQTKYKFWQQKCTGRKSSFPQIWENLALVFCHKRQGEGMEKASGQQCLSRVKSCEPDTV